MNNQLKHFLSFAVIMSISSYSFANGLEYKYNHNESMKQKAFSGDPQAQYVYATMLLKGNGVEKDIGQAKSFYLKAAEQNHPGAQSMLGQIYHQGIGVPQDKNIAIHYYKLAAAQGNQTAQNALYWLLKQK